MIGDVVELLACPVCGLALKSEEAVLRCGSGHSFDIARHGYVNLLSPGARPTASGDTAAMVEARRRFLGAGHFAPLERLLAAQALASAGSATESGAVPVADAGAGSGHHLARVLTALGESSSGVALDSSRYAARRAARAHPRAGAVVCDVWRRLPLRDRSVSLLLDVFAPRNGREFHRVLRPGGSLVVVTPTGRHLRELVAALDLLRVDERKDERLAEEVDELFERLETLSLEWEMELERGDVEALVGMGPSARHGDPAARVAKLGIGSGPVAVTASMTVAAFRPRGNSQALS